jgi:hypothetical protein
MCSGCCLVKDVPSLFLVFYEHREGQDEHKIKSKSKISSLRSTRPEVVFEKALIMFTSKSSAA